MELESRAGQGFWARLCRSGGLREAEQEAPGGAPEAVALLASAPVESVRLVDHGSNYTFLACLQAPGGQRLDAVYKPRQGEAPLWDFPTGTLYKRECAAYLLAEALGWRFIPATVVREGPYGIGSMQLFVRHNPREHYLTLRDGHPEEVRRICLFDWLANNADRKAGHVLLGPDGRLWGIDHGLTFHPQHKLRTVIWDFAGEPVPPSLLSDLRSLQERLAAPSGPLAGMAGLLAPEEMEALARRLARILERPLYPDQSEIRRPYPWPWL